MNRFKFGLFVLALSSFAFSIKCAQESSEAERKKEKNNEMQDSLFRGARFAVFNAVEKALRNPDVDINARNEKGDTALTLLANCRNYDYDAKRDAIKKIAIYLLDHGADLNITDTKTSVVGPVFKGETPLGIANKVIVRDGVFVKANEAFIEAVDYRKNYPRFKTALMPHLVKSDILIQDLYPLVTEYAYESPGLESDEKMKKE